MSGELIFLFYYCGLMVALGFWANWILKKEFAKMNEPRLSEREGVSE